jgi:hypothetical protein
MFALVHQERDPQGQMKQPRSVVAIERAEQPAAPLLSDDGQRPAEQISLDRPVQLMWTDRHGLARLALEPESRG